MEVLAVVEYYDEDKINKMTCSSCDFCADEADFAQAAKEWFRRTKKRKTSKFVCPKCGGRKRFQVFPACNFVQNN